MEYDSSHRVACYQVNPENRDMFLLVALKVKCVHVEGESYVMLRWI